MERNPTENNLQSQSFCDHLRADATQLIAPTLIGRISIYAPQKDKGIRNRIRECKDCLEDERRRLFDELAKQRVSDCLPKSTRGKHDGSDKNKGSNKSRNKDGTVGRVGKRDKPSARVSNSPFYNMTITDGTVSIDATSRCADGSYKSIASTKLEESAVVKGIGKISAIEPIRLEIALKKGERAKHLLLSRSWTAS